MFKVKTRSEGKINFLRRSLALVPLLVGLNVLQGKIEVSIASLRSLSPGQFLLMLLLALVYMFLMGWPDDSEKSSSSFLQVLKAGATDTALQIASVTSFFSPILLLTRELGWPSDIALAVGLAIGIAVNIVLYLVFRYPDDKAFFQQEQDNLRAQREHIQTRLHRRKTP